MKRFLYTFLILSVTSFLTGCGSGGSSKKETTYAENEKAIVETLEQSGAKVGYTHEGSVRKVTFTASSVSDEALIPLKNLPELSYLSLSGTGVTDAGLDNISGATKLYLLNLSGTQVGDEGLAKIKNLSGITVLKLGGTKITDQGMTHLKEMTGLTSLDLSNTDITDEGLSQLSTLSELTEFFLTGTKVTEETAIKMRENFPQVQIYSYPKEPSDAVEENAAEE